jgi:hypothetical protein
VTEAKWVACTDPQKMLRFLLGTDFPRVQDVKTFPACKTSERKLRLFACACYHRIRHLLPDALAQAAVDVAERFADGGAKVERLQLSTALIWRQLQDLEGRWRASQGTERIALRPTHEALALALQVVSGSAPKAAYYASSNAYLTVAAIANPGVACSDSGYSRSQAAEERIQTDILRCIFDYLFHPMTIAPAVLAWNDGMIPELAQSIFDNRAFDRLPILADALEVAGCQDADLLAHCRNEGPHVRGCWAVDLLLGKQ